MARANLNRETVVEAAAALLDAEGPKGVTMAALAKRLGVKSPSLYNHVGGLDELLRALRLRALGELEARLAAAAVGRSGAEALHAVAHAYRGYMKEAPGLYLLTLESTVGGDQELRAAGDRVVQVLTAALRGYDLVGPEAVHAIRFLRSALHGFVVLEGGGGFALDVPTEESFGRLVAMLDAALARLIAHE